MKTKYGSCHCGAVQFEITLHADLRDYDLRRCNCSLCRRKGAIMAGIPKRDFRLIKGAAELTAYIWNTHIAKHYFCRICGIYTHHSRRSAPDDFGVNIGCLDGVDAFMDAPVGDGAAMSVVELLTSP